MKGQINFDISNDQDIMEMCEWLNNHKGFNTDMSFNGRYISVTFEENVRPVKKVEK